MISHNVIKTVSAVLLVLLIFLGFEVAKHKHLWGDEIYTHLASVEDKSYLDIMFGKTVEGNVCPLFYLTQKAITQVVQFETPKDWYAGEKNSWRIGPMIILRIGPVVCMALALVLLFYGFSRMYSIWWGFYVLGLTLDSYMVWQYWAEARPYALWFLLTVVQSILLLLALNSKVVSAKFLRSLFVTNILLAFTVVFSMFQVAIITFLLWFFVDRGVRKYIILTIIPISIAGYYYTMGPDLKFWFPPNYMTLIYPTIPKERVIFIGIMLLSSLFYFPKHSKSSTMQLKSASEKDYFGVLLYMIIMFVVAFFILAIFCSKAVPMTEGFQISMRYFIFLTPISSISITVIMIYLLRRWRYCPWVRLNLMLLSVGLLLIDYFKNCMGTTIVF